MGLLAFLQKTKKNNNMKNFIKNLFSKEEKIPLKLGRIHERGVFYPKRKKIVTKGGMILNEHGIITFLSSLAYIANIQYKYKLRDRYMYELPKVYRDIIVKCYLT